MDFLIVIDMQNDFVTGSLGSDNAVKIVPNVVDKIKNFNGTVLYTRDTHNEDYLNTLEGSKLPVKHCIKGTFGHEIIAEIKNVNEETVLDKYSFGSANIYDFIKRKTDEKIDSITLIGLCTDICVISNAMLLKAFTPETPIIVDASCCAGVTQQSHKNAIKAMKMCQIDIENE